MKTPKSRFNILRFVNPRTDTISWRVSGIKRNGERIRENFADPDEANIRHAALEAEYLATNGVSALRATRLSDEQIGIAEAAFKRLERDQDLITAVDHWLRTGKPSVIVESPRLEEALKTYLAWLETTQDLRLESKRNLRNRVTCFVNGVQNMRVTDVLPDHIEKYLATRNVSPTTKDGDRRAISCFFSWCIKGKRHWAVNNPCYAVEVDGAGRGEHEPVLLPLEDCEKLLRAAEGHKNGVLVPYVALCMFGGLRPSEAARVGWDQVNLVDGELRLRPDQTKTGKGRTLEIQPALKVWLKAYKGRDEIYRPSFDLELCEVRASIGYGGSQEDAPDGKAQKKTGDSSLKPWVPDTLRHTAISHYFRLTGSYGRSAEQFGNSEAIIKKHYQSRVSSEETKKFYALRPKEREKSEKQKDQVSQGFEGHIRVTGEHGEERAASQE